MTLVTLQDTPAAVMVDMKTREDQQEDMKTGELLTPGADLDHHPEVVQICFHQSFILSYPRFRG